MGLSRKWIFTIGIICYLTTSFAQSYYKFAVYFSDKSPVGYPYNISNPQDFLSDRSIDRRVRYNISVTSRDLPVAPSYIAGVLAVSDSIQFYNKSKWMNCIVIGTSDSTLATAIDALPYVTQVRWIFKGNRPQTANDSPVPLGPAITIQNNYGIDYGNADTQSTMMGLDYLHRRDFHGKGMVIAVLDAGFTNTSVITGFNHLRDSSRILGTWDFVKNEPGVAGDNSHGTMVLSCMGGYIPGQFMGTAPGASYWLLRTEEGAAETVSEEYNWVAGAEFADSAGADIINSSLGYTTFDFPSMNHAYADLNGHTTVISRGAAMVSLTGMIVCNSAGNSGANSWHYLGAPADADSILSVGAVKRDRSIASFSSFGPSADGRIKPDVCSMGEQSYVIGIMGMPMKGNGTSFSSPILCGAVACLWQKHPEKTNFEIMDAIRKSAHLYSTPTAQEGYGIPNFGVADKLLETVDFSNYQADQNVVIYPNPVTGSDVSFDLYSNLSEDIFVSIATAGGQVVFTQTIHTFEKSLNTYNLQLKQQLARGVYMFTIYTSQKTFRLKFLAQ